MATEWNPDGPDERYLRETWVEAANLEAISVSMEIIISFFSHMTALRSCTWWWTQALKSSPRTTAQTFTSHCLGTLGMSMSSGRKSEMLGLSAANWRMRSMERALYWGTNRVLTAWFGMYAFFRHRMSFKK